MIGADGVLTQQELDTFKAFKNSEFLRIAKKLISHEYAKRCAQLASPATKSTEQLHGIQGQLQGLSSAYNLLDWTTKTAEPELKKTNLRLEA